MAKDDFHHPHPSQDRRADLATAAARCVKCGRCLSVCPVYLQTRREAEVARGKLALMEAVATGPEALSGEKVKDILSYCLLCGACAENCPNLVAADEVIREGRELFSSGKNPGRLLKTALSRILPFSARMDLFHRVGRKLQPLMLKKIPRESGLHWRTPLGEARSSRLVPRLADKPFMKRYQQKDNVQKPAALLFVGCVSNYIFPGVAQSVLTLLQRLNLPVLIPLEQGCCGLMASGAGEIAVARRIAARTIEMFTEKSPVPIVAFCSSCSAHLKNYPELFEGEEWHQRALEFSHRVKDLSEFLVEAGFSSTVELQAKSSTRLTFHDPCHLQRKQGIVEPPRTLLRSIKGAEFVETGREKLCCGSGGSFNLSHYDVSMDIFRRRLKPIQESQVDTVVTSCMGCLLQFLDGLHQEGQGVEAKHLAEVLSKTITVPKN
jgi:glycolate oxidase iron-sulfur subunit